MLLHGVDLELMDEQGNTALGSAAKARQHKAVAFLLQNGAKPNPECVSCWTSMPCLLLHL
jgi:ankyrin repeat protein